MRASTATNWRLPARWKRQLWPAQASGDRPKCQRRVGVTDHAVDVDPASHPGGHVQRVDDQHGGHRPRRLPPAVSSSTSRSWGRSPIRGRSARPPSQPSGVSRPAPWPPSSPRRASRPSAGGPRAPSSPLAHAARRGTSAAYAALQCLPCSMLVSEVRSTRGSQSDSERWVTVGSLCLGCSNRVLLHG
jgi:hypothetical protein